MGVMRSVRRLWTSNPFTQKLMYLALLVLSLYMLAEDTLYLASIPARRDNQQLPVTNNVKSYNNSYQYHNYHNNHNHGSVSGRRRKGKKPHISDIDRILNHSRRTSYNSSLVHLPVKYYMGVLSSESYLKTRATDAYNTWAKDVEHLDFYVGETVKIVPNNMPVVKLKDVDDSAYPPQKKGFRLLQYWCDHLLDKYDWFIKADDDTYVKTALLERFLWTLDEDQKYYIGRPGMGVVEEMHLLGLDGNLFCTGPTVIYSKPLLQELCPRLELCLKNVTTIHEDTEVGRCVIYNTGLQCAINHKPPALQSLFYTTYEGDYFFGNLTHNPGFQPAITVHAVKDSTLLFNIHYYYKRWLHNFLKSNIKQPPRKSNPLQIEQLEAVKKREKAAAGVIFSGKRN